MNIGIDWLALFQNFGYPALISGVLLYIVIYKLERINLEIVAVKGELIKIGMTINEARTDIKDLDRRDSPAERRRP